MSTATIHAERGVCIGSGLCAAFAPDVFGTGDDDLVEILTDADPARADVTRAIVSCPVGALSWTNEEESRA
jgi:ferredoxin